MVRSSPLQRLDTLTQDVTVLESDVANVASNVASLSVLHIVETANVTGNLILTSANGVAYSLTVVT